MIRKRKYIDFHNIIMNSRFKIWNKIKEVVQNKLLDELWLSIGSQSDDTLKTNLSKRNYL